MAKKKADTVDLREALKDRIQALVNELVDYHMQLSTCVNERAHLRQFYLGRIEQAEAELAHIKGLLDG